MQLAGGRVDGYRDRLRARRVIPALAIALLGMLVLAASAAAVEVEQMASWPSTKPATPIGIAAARDGGAWFTEHRGGIGYVSSSKVLKEYPLPSGAVDPEALVLAADGTVWATAADTTYEHEVIVHRLKTGKFKLYKMSGHGFSNSYGGGIVEGPDGNIWFTLGDKGGHIGRITPKGQLTLFPLPVPERYSGGEQRPFSITRGPDGALWFTDQIYPSTDGVGRITTSGDVSYFPYQPFSVSAQNSITTGPDGALWIVDSSDHRIYRLTTSGAFSYFEVGNQYTATPEEIVSGPDGALWFTTNTVPGRLELDGQYSFISTQIMMESGGIAASSQGYIWLANGTYDQIDRFSVAVSGESEYVALGDSYSSGEGNPPYEAGTDTSGEVPDRCHRSLAAYGPQLAASLAWSAPTFKACSGAVTNDIFVRSWGNLSEPAQRSWLSSHTRTITLTIGGNDAGFPWVMRHCISFPPLIDQFHCSADKQLNAETQARLIALQGGPYATAPPPLSQPIHSIVSVLEALHAGAPSAHIYLGLYPTLFGKSASHYAKPFFAPKTLACEVGYNLWVSHKDAVWLDHLAKDLNRSITTAIKRARPLGITVTPVGPSQFSGHGLCDESEPWFYPLALQAEIHTLPELEAALAAQPASFHPTEAGQLGYEIAFANASAE